MKPVFSAFSAKRKILVADSTKFDRVSLVEICGIMGVDMIVTDSNPGREWKDYLDEMGIGLYFPADS